ncbi:MAG: rRNA pseudouridine synthase [Myxococcaceae bacterium]|nr:rRNA pseudouridine synthase [Myxococcaceae bacterium]
MPRKRKHAPKWLEAARQGGRPGETTFDWISRALARAGVIPLRDAEAAVQAGRVQVAGRTVTAPISLVRPGDEVRVDGKVVSIAATTRCLMFHKPAGIVTAGSDPEGIGTVFEALGRVLPPELARYGWHAIGRLDRDTTGLLLFTNDEKLVAHATLPERHLPKRYVAQVQGTPTDEKLDPLRRGVMLQDGLARPARAEIRADCRVELTITEGRNHQVKRMLSAVKLPVVQLHREAVGGVVLDVPEGAFRELSAEEIEAGLGFTPRTIP